MISLIYYLGFNMLADDDDDEDADESIALPVAGISDDTYNASRTCKVSS